MPGPPPGMLEAPPGLPGASSAVPAVPRARPRVLGACPGMPEAHGVSPVVPSPFRDALSHLGMPAAPPAVPGLSRVTQRPVRLGSLRAAPRWCCAKAGRNRNL